MKPYEKGFYLRDAIGNNAFSFALRKEKEIYVAPFVEKEDFELAEGSKTAFIEVEEREEKRFVGLSEFLIIKEKNKNIYVFDNHNHAFYVIFKEVYQQSVPKGLPLIHFDQHKDMRRPPRLFHEVCMETKEVSNFLRKCQPEDFSESIEITEEHRAFFYCNAVLNVGNFIVPMLEEGWISKAVMMDSSTSLMQAEEILSDCSEYILDIDLDFFSEEMDYISYDKKVETIRRFLPSAKLVTVCTSPFFVSFERAEKAWKDIFQKIRGRGFLGQ